MRALGPSRALAAGRWLTAALLALALPACEDLRAFEGHWRGAIVRDPELARGFAPGAAVAATIQHASRTRLAMTLHLPAEASPGLPGGELTFEEIRGATADALGEMHLPGDPLRTVLGYVRPVGQEAILVFVSLLPDERLALRLIRGPDELYGLFELRRTRD